MNWLDELKKLQGPYLREEPTVRPLIPTNRRDDLIDAAQHYGRTIIFALGVVKAAELVFKKRIL